MKPKKGDLVRLLPISSRYRNRINKQGETWQVVKTKYPPNKRPRVKLVPRERMDGRHLWVNPADVEPYIKEEYLEAN